MLDAGEGRALHTLLLPGTQPLRTMDEGDWGRRLADVTCVRGGGPGGALGVYVAAVRGDSGQVGAGGFSG